MAQNKVEKQKQQQKSLHLRVWTINLTTHHMFDVIWGKMMSTDAAQFTKAG